MIKGLEELSCDERLREVGLFSQEKAPGRPSSRLSVKGAYEKRAGEGLLTSVWIERRRGNGFKLREGKF